MSTAIGPTVRHFLKASPSLLIASSTDESVPRLAEKADSLSIVTTALLPVASIATREVLLVVYPARSRPNPITAPISPAAAYDVVLTPRAPDARQGLRTGRARRCSP